MPVIWQYKVLFAVMKQGYSLFLLRCVVQNADVRTVFDQVFEAWYNLRRACAVQFSVLAML